MASGRSQILKEADNQWTVLFFTGGDLTHSQVNVTSAAAALDIVKPLAAALPGVMKRITIDVQTDET